MKAAFVWPNSLLGSLCLVITCLVCTVQAEPSAKKEFQILSMSSKPTSTSDGGKDNTVGQRACIDPKTGKLVSPEERPECKSQAGAEQTTKGVTESTEGLKEEQMPDGSTKVDLQGRFKKHSQPSSLQSP